MRRLCVALAAVAALSGAAGPAAAIEGFDRMKHSRIVIVGGDRLAVGEYIDIYVSDKNQVYTVLIQNITPVGAELEIDSFDFVHGEHRIFEIPANVDTDLHAQTPQLGR